MRRIDTLRRSPAVTEERFSWQEFVNLFGRTYGVGGSYGVDPAANFAGYVRDVAERNGVVAACITARALLMSQVRFTWRADRAASNAGTLFGNRDLAILERPGQMTRPELLSLAEQDVSCAGTFYARRKGDELYRLRPDGVTVALTSELGPTDGWVPSDAKISGFIYRDPSKPKSRPEAFLPEEIIQWKGDRPHPIEWWRGQSWITSVMSEIRNDGQATTHTSKFFENAATPNLVFTMDPKLSPEQVQAYADVLNAKFAGSGNAYKNMYLGGGTDVKVVGSMEAAIGLKDVQGGYETRIAAASRVPAVVLGIREGLAGSALNAGNYGTARRLWADGWFTPNVQSLCAAVERVMPVPENSELWYDASEVLFLQEDAKDDADIQSVKAQAIRTLTDAGYTPLSVIDAVEANDFSLLKHSGLYSVQLQAPGAGQPSSNGQSVSA